VASAAGQGEIGSEAAEHFVAVARAEDRAGVDGGDHGLGEVGVRHVTSISCDSEASAEERLGGGSSEEDQDFRLDHRQFRVEPWPTGEGGARVAST